MIVLLGDVGTPHGAYHLGDEAMLESALEALRARGLTHVSVVSSDPASTAEAYAVNAVNRVGFTLLSPAERDERLEAVTATAQGARGRLRDDDPAHAVIAAVAASDGVVITGGGNLTVHWPDHVAERAALARIASALGKPIVLSGQMVGPHLDEPTGRLAAELIASAALVGVRDARSRSIVHDLVGSRTVSLLADDAFALGAASSDDPFGAVADGPVVATVAPWLGGLDLEDVASGVADLLAVMSDLAQKDVLFLPHVGTLGQTDDGDSAVHARIVEKLGYGELGSLLPAAEAARRHRAAAFSFSSRYHPVVFSATAGRPVVAAPVDTYTATKIRGALAVMGAQDALLPLGTAGTQAARAAVREVWGARHDVHAVARDRWNALQRAHDSWWDAVAELLTATSPSSPVLEQGLDVGEAAPLSLMTSELRSDLDRLGRAMLTTGTELSLERLRRDAIAAAVAEADKARQAAERTAADALRDVQQREATITELDDALAAAHRVQVALADPAVRRALSRNVERYIPPSTIEALLETRSFRWSRGARRLVAAVRRMTGRSR
jgi:polysaccharide pyruvyl transferase WcaK-like protein